jgi:hypothetical protein
MAETAAVSPRSLAPVVDGPVRGEEGARALVAAHDELEQILGSAGWELAHAEVIDDEQRHGGHAGEVLLARPIERRIGELFEQPVGLAVGDLVALGDGGEANGLREVTLARARRAEEEHIFVLLDDVARSKTSRRFSFGLKSKSKRSSEAARSRKRASSMRRASEANPASSASRRRSGQKSASQDAS